MNIENKNTEDSIEKIDQKEFDQKEFATFMEGELKNEEENTTKNKVGNNQGSDKTNSDSDTVNIVDVITEDMFKDISASTPWLAKKMCGDSLKQASQGEIDYHFRPSDNGIKIRMQLFTLILKKHLGEKFRTIPELALIISFLAESFFMAMGWGSHIKTVKEALGEESK